MPLIPSRNAAVFFSVLVPHYPLQMISLDPALSFFRSISSARYPELENEGQESKISRTLKQPSTSCLSFSSQFLSIEQEERRRPQTGQEDRKTG